MNVSEDDPYAEWKRWRPEDFGRFSARDAVYYRWHVRRALNGEPAGTDILEMGYGNGKFMGWARAQGHRVVGLETNPHLLRLARGAGFAAEASLGGLDGLDAGRPLDLVVGFDVLEHVPPTDLPALLTALAQRLKPGGAMLFRFPNGQSPLGRITQHGDATHVNTLSATKMRQLALTVGLVLQHSGEPLPWHARRRRSMPGALLGSVLRAAFEWTIGRLYLGRRVSWAPNEVVVLRIARPAAATAASTAAPPASDQAPAQVVGQGH